MPSPIDPPGVQPAGDAPRSRAAVRREPTAREHRTDIALGIGIFVGAILSTALGSIAQVYGEEQAPLSYALIYALAIAAPLAVRRRFPGTVAVLIAVAYFLAVTLRVPEIFVGNIGMFIGLYTVGAWVNDRRRALIVRVGIIFGMFVWLIIVMYRDAIDNADKADVAAGAFSPYVAYMLLNLLMNVLYFGGAYYFGERTWNAAQQRAVLEQRTADLERERELTAAQAVALDRVRIARELHDVVAHHVSVMGVQAGAARMVLDQNPEETRRILTGIETSARDSISELRHLLETLRTPGGGAEDAASTLSLDDLPALAKASTDAGLPTTFTVVGESVPTTSLVAINLYRIAQESLTNARRHAGPYATADVRLRYTDDAIELEIVNTGRTVPSLRPGLGLVGMRERALASGGTIEIVPRSAGGFRVRASVPLPTDATTTPRRRTTATR